MQAWDYARCMSTQKQAEQSPLAVEALEPGLLAAPLQNQKREVPSMWASIKSEYWSMRGVVVTALHMTTLIAAILVYVGWYQVWYGTSPLPKEIHAKN